MITEELQKALDSCLTEQELNAVLDAHKNELTDEEFKQISGEIFAFSELMHLWDRRVWYTDI